MQAALLPERGVIKVSGDDARRLLNGLLTVNIESLPTGRPRFAALLTPQGKIIADFFVIEAGTADGGGFFLDCPRALAGELADRLNFYKLRAKVTIDDLSGPLGVLALWDGGGASGPVLSDYGLSFGDPRLPALGSRVLLPPEVATDAAGDLGATLTDADAYERRRIALGIPRGGLDFTYGDTFPHEADMDQLGGIDFDKGCYIGQEVVSRIEHRATARNRVVPVGYDDAAPMSGLPVVVGDKYIGIVGSMADGRGLALLRLDRVADALAAGEPINAGGVPLRLVKPDWAKFPWPGEATSS